MFQHDKSQQFSFSNQWHGMEVGQGLIQAKPSQVKLSHLTPWAWTISWGEMKLVFLVKVRSLSDRAYVGVKRVRNTAFTPRYHSDNASLASLLHHSAR